MDILKVLTNGGGARGGGGKEDTSFRFFVNLVIYKSNRKMLMQNKKTIKFFTKYFHRIFFFNFTINEIIAFKIEEICQKLHLHQRAGQRCNLTEL